MSTENFSNTVGKERGTEIFGGRNRVKRRLRPSLTIREAPRDTPVFAETDVLVVGGGPSGTSAAIAAGRLGADVMLIERYNHLGGLSTGGLVIWIDRMSDWSGQQVISGLARDFLDRLPDTAVQGPPRADWGSSDTATAAYWGQRTAAFHGITTWSPTIDPEALKTLSIRMALEQKVRLIFHAWVVEPIVENGVMRGAIFESKEGRQAVFAKTVVDTTGDADLLSRAGISSEMDSDETDIHHCINTAFMIGGVDMERWLAFRANDKDGFKDFMTKGRKKLKYFEKPFVSWRNDIALFMGPRLSGYSAINIDDLSEIEIRSRLLTVGHVDAYREAAPGFENAFLMLGAPQIGVRHSRRLIGEKKIMRAQWDAGKVWSDEIGVSPSLSPKFPNISVPYGALVPIGIEGVIGAGRHISCDTNSHSFLREIPQCWMTGHAAGVAAALAANTGVNLRDLEPRLIQEELLRQGAYLSPSIEVGLASTSQAAE